jgi:hypothetical protein
VKVEKIKSELLETADCFLEGQSHKTDIFFEDLCGARDWPGVTASISSSVLGEHLGSFLAGLEDWNRRGEFSLRANLEDVENLRLGQ